MQKAHLATLFIIYGNSIQLNYTAKFVSYNATF